MASRSSQNGPELERRLCGKRSGWRQAGRAPGPAPGAAHAVASQEAVEGGGLPRPARALEGGTCCSCMPALPPAPHRSSESRCDPILPLGRASAPQDPARLPHPCSSLRFCLSLLSPVPHTPGGRCQKPELPGSGNVSPRSPPHTPNRVRDWRSLIVAVIVATGPRNPRSRLPQRMEGSWNLLIATVTKSRAAWE